MGVPGCALRGVLSLQGVDGEGEGMVWRRGVPGMGLLGTANLEGEVWTARFDTVRSVSSRLRLRALDT